MSLKNVVRKTGEREIVVIAGDVNGHVGSNPENYREQYGGQSYEVRKKERERSLDFYVAMNMVV